jgi:hypothetical protein
VSDQDGARRVAHRGLGDRAEEESLEAAVAVRADRDEVVAALGGEARHDVGGGALAHLELERVTVAAVGGE